MNLLFDLIAAQPIMGEKVHGGGKYTKKLFFELLKCEKRDLKILALFDSHQQIDKDIVSLSNDSRVRLVDIRKNNIKEIIAINEIDRCYFALPYSLAFNLLEVFESDCEVIITIHGLRDLEMAPGFEGLKFLRSSKKKAIALIKSFLDKYMYKKKYAYYLELLKKAKITTVSNHSKFAIKAYFPYHKHEINVFYSPDVTDLDDEENGLIPEFNETGYFLLVNGNRWIKNNLRSAIALDQLFTERKEIANNVIITGVSNRNLYLPNLKNKERFIFYDFVNEAFLKILYQNAYALIYMSLNEGFGYPPLEAMKFGIPVIASPFTSIPEICGNAVLYSNPYAIQEIKNRILQLKEPEIYNSMKESGLKRFGKINKLQNNHLELMIKYLSS